MKACRNSAVSLITSILVLCKSSCGNNKGFRPAIKMWDLQHIFGRRTPLPLWPPWMRKSRTASTRTTSTPAKHVDWAGCVRPAHSLSVYFMDLSNERGRFFFLEKQFVELFFYKALRLKCRSLLPLGEPWAAESVNESLCREQAKTSHWCIREQT